MYFFFFTFVTSISAACVYSSCLCHWNEEWLLVGLWGRVRLRVVIVRKKKTKQQMECVVSNPDSVALIPPALQECPRWSQPTKWPFGFEPDWAGDNKVDQNGVVSHARAGWGHVLCDYGLKTFGLGLVICGDFLAMLPASLNLSACKNYVTRWRSAVGKNHNLRMCHCGTGLHDSLEVGTWNGGQQRMKHLVSCQVGPLSVSWFRVVGGWRSRNNQLTE